MSRRASQQQHRVQHISHLSLPPSLHPFHWRCPRKRHVLFIVLLPGEPWTHFSQKMLGRDHSQNSDLAATAAALTSQSPAQPTAQWERQEREQDQDRRDAHDGGSAPLQRQDKGERINLTMRI